MILHSYKTGKKFNILWQHIRWTWSAEIQDGLKEYEALEVLVWSKTKLVLLVLTHLCPKLHLFVERNENSTDKQAELPPH